MLVNKINVIKHSAKTPLCRCVWHTLILTARYPVGYDSAMMTFCLCGVQMLLALFVGMMIALCFLLPMIGIPLLLLGVALYGFGKGFFGSMIESFSKK